MDKSNDIRGIAEYGNSLIPSSDLQQEMESVASIAKILEVVSNLPNTLRREFRGEMYWEDKDGNGIWVQGQKPVFIKLDPKTRKPIKETILMPWDEEKEVYVANDEAIEEVLSILKFAGINQINPVGFNNEDNYLDDLKEFECKLAALLCCKQVDWGLDKELMPMIQFKLKTIIQDARALSRKGTLLKAITQTVQRVEQYIENDQNKKKAIINPY